MEKGKRAAIGYLLMLQALREMTDDPALSDLLKSRTIANHAKRLSEAIEAKTEKVVYFGKSDKAAEQMFTGALVICHFVDNMLMLPDDRMEEVDAKMEKLFELYTQPTPPDLSPVSVPELQAWFNLYRNGGMTLDQIAERINRKVL